MSETPTMILRLGTHRINHVDTDKVLPRVNIINTKTGESFPETFALIGDNLLTTTKRIVFDPWKNTAGGATAHYKRTHEPLITQLKSLDALKHRYRLASEQFLFDLQAANLLPAKTGIGRLNWRVGMILSGAKHYYLLPLFYLNEESVKSVALAKGSLETKFDLFLG